MVKIHPTEECINYNCKNLVGTLTPDAHEGLKQATDAIIDFKNEKAKRDFLFIVTSYGIIDDESDIVRFLCPTCCREILKEATLWFTKKRKEILSQSFDSLREKL